jgi:hypothetical protein
MYNMKHQKSLKWLLLGTIFILSHVEAQEQVCPVPETIDKESSCVPGDAPQMNQHDSHNTNRKPEESSSHPIIYYEITWGHAQWAQGQHKDKILHNLQVTNTYMTTQVLVQEEFESVRGECINFHTLCSFWAATGTNESRMSRYIEKVACSSFVLYS